MATVKLTIEGESGDVITLLNAFQKFSELRNISWVEDPNYYRLSFDTTVTKKVEAKFHPAELRKYAAIPVVDSSRSENY